MRYVWRYSFAFVGAYLAMFAHIYWLFGRGDWLVPQRLSSAIAGGLIFAHLVAAMVLIGRDIKLAPPLMGLLVRLVGSVALGSLAWFAHVYLFLYQTQPDVLILVFGGAGLAIGFVVAGSFSIGEGQWRVIVAIIVTTIAIYLPIVTTHYTYNANPSAQALLYFQPDNPVDVYRIGLPFALTITLMAYVPFLFNSWPFVKPQSRPALDHE